MPVSMEFLRGVLGLLAVFFGHMMGRSVVAVRKGRTKPLKLTGWAIRTVLCAAAMLFPRRQVDPVALGVWALTALAIAAGIWVAAREKPEEEIDLTIFPDEH